MNAAAFFLYGIVLVPVIHSQIDGYHFVNLNLTWTQARQHCREHHNDLATVEREENLNQIFIPDGAVAWIGLFDDPASWRGAMTLDSNSWRWSATGSVSSSRYMRWRSYQPDYTYAIDQCTLFKDGEWVDENCHKNVYMSACYTVESGVKQFIYINSPMAWKDALNHCRKHYHDLAMIESLADNQALESTLQGMDGYAWIGLYREPWRWSDSSNSSFRRWARGEPNNKFNQHCAAMGSDSQWGDEQCELQLPFICYETAGWRKKLTKVNLRLQSTAELSDFTINSQITQALNLKLGINETGSQMEHITLATNP